MLAAAASATAGASARAAVDDRLLDSLAENYEQRLAQLQNVIKDLTERLETSSQESVASSRNGGEDSAGELPLSQCSSNENLATELSQFTPPRAASNEDLSTHLDSASKEDASGVPSSDESGNDKSKNNASNTAGATWRQDETTLEVERLRAQVSHLVCQKTTLETNLEKSQAYCEQLTIVLGRYISSQHLLKTLVEEERRLLDATDQLVAVVRLQKQEVVTSARLSGPPTRERRQEAASLRAALDALQEQKRLMAGHVAKLLDDQRRSDSRAPLDGAHKSLPDPASNVDSQRQAALRTLSSDPPEQPEEQRQPPKEQLLQRQQPAQQQQLKQVPTEQQHEVASKQRSVPELSDSGRRASGLPRPTRELAAQRSVSTGGPPVPPTGEPTSKRNNESTGLVSATAGSGQLAFEDAEGALVGLVHALRARCTTLRIALADSIDKVSPASWGGATDRLASEGCAFDDTAAAPSAATTIPGAAPLATGTARPTPGSPTPNPSQPNAGGLGSSPISAGVVSSRNAVSPTPPVSEQELLQLREQVASLRLSRHLQAREARFLQSELATKECLMEALQEQNELLSRECQRLELTLQRGLPHEPPDHSGCGEALSCATTEYRLRKEKFFKRRVENLTEVSDSLGKQCAAYRQLIRRLQHDNVSLLRRYERLKRKSRQRALAGNSDNDNGHVTQLEPNSALPQEISADTPG